MAKFKERYQYIFAPESEEQALRIAGWLEYKQIPYKTGFTRGKRNGIFVVQLSLVERIQFFLAFGHVFEFEYVVYYELANRSGI